MENPALARAACFDLVFVLQIMLYYSAEELT